MAEKVANLPPVSTLFAAFLGYNPLAHLLPSSVLSSLPAAHGPSFSAARSSPTSSPCRSRSGLHAAFDFAALGCLIAAGASWSRGKRYVYRAPSSSPAPAEVAGPAPASGRPSGFGVVVSVGLGLSVVVRVGLGFVVRIGLGLSVVVGFGVGPGAGVGLQVGSSRPRRRRPADGQSGANRRHGFARSQAAWLPFRTRSAHGVRRGSTCALAGPSGQSCSDRRAGRWKRVEGIGLDRPEAGHPLARSQTGVRRVRPFSRAQLRTSCRWARPRTSDARVLPVLVRHPPSRRRG